MQTRGSRLKALTPCCVPCHIQEHINNNQRTKNNQQKNNNQQTITHTLLTRELLVLFDELLEGHSVFLSDGQIIQHAFHLGCELRATLALQL